MTFDVDLFKLIVALACLGSTLYSLHRGWNNAAGWFGIFTFFAVLGMNSV